jgi:AhpD family alkylhydroperoxidase
LKNKFVKRIYQSPKEFLSDLWFALKNINRLRKLEKTGAITPAFRERLMLAVTAVNGCRYCSYVHARQALKTGLDQAEINRLLSNDVANCPEDEAVAVLYAQHWAEANAHPDPEATLKLREAYGPEKTGAIHLVLRMIRLANLSGNLLDYLMYHLSFGKMGR